MLTSSAMQHQNQSVDEPALQDKVALLQRAWTTLLPAVAVLQRRLDAATLLPGSVREEERAFDTYMQAAGERARAVPQAQLTDAATRHRRSVAVGCATLNPSFVGLNLLFTRPWPPWPAAERGALQPFVLAALDTVPATADVGFRRGNELQLVSFFEQDLGERLCVDPAFHAAVMAKWTKPAVADVLRGRGSLQRGVSFIQEDDNVIEALKRADVAARGYRACGLPSCGKREVTVRHFKLCGGCDAVAYCCDEHHDAHWTEGHRRECRHLRAAGARPPSTADVA